MGTPVERLSLESEAFREYIYEDGNVLVIVEPTELFITESGSHRVVAADGRTYRPTPGYLGIAWKPKTGQPAFVA
jgi:hypothetical protein